MDHAREATEVIAVLRAALAEQAATLAADGARADASLAALLAAVGAPSDR